MGNTCTSTSNSKYQKYLKEQYPSFKKNFFNQHQKIDLGYCKVWKRKLIKNHNLNHNNENKKKSSLQFLEEQIQTQILQQYKITIDNEKEYSQYMGMLRLRMNSYFFVDIYHLMFPQNSTSSFLSLQDNENDYYNNKINQSSTKNNLLKKDQFLCTAGNINNHNTILLIERIPFRLSNLLHVPLSKILLIIKQSIISFKILYEIYGLFIVNSNMFGFNNKSKLKIWIHTDFSQAKPQNPFCESLKQMLTSIIKSIQKYIDRPFDQQLFSQFLSIRQNFLYSQSFQNFQKGFEIYLQKNNFIQKLKLKQIKIQKMSSYLNGNLPGIGYMSQFQEKIQNFLNQKAQYQKKLQNSILSNADDTQIKTDFNGKINSATDLSNNSNNQNNNFNHNHNFHKDYHNINTKNSKSNQKIYYTYNLSSEPSPSSSYKNIYHHNINIDDNKASQMTVKKQDLFNINNQEDKIFNPVNNYQFKERGKVKNQTQQKSILKINFETEKLNHPGNYFQRDNLHMMDSLKESKVNQNTQSFDQKIIQKRNSSQSYDRFYLSKNQQSPKKYKFSFTKFNFQNKNNFQQLSSKEQIQKSLNSTLQKNWLKKIQSQKLQPSLTFQNNNPSLISNNLFKNNSIIQQNSYQNTTPTKTKSRKGYHSIDMFGTFGSGLNINNSQSGCIKNFNNANIQRNQQEILISQKKVLIKQPPFSKNIYLSRIPLQKQTIFKYTPAQRLLSPSGIQKNQEYYSNLNYQNRNSIINPNTNVSAFTFNNSSNINNNNPNSYTSISIKKPQNNTSFTSNRISTSNDQSKNSINMSPYKYHPSYSSSKFHI